MGTRGMNVVVIDGETKVAQYNQWDSYPGGQGIDVLDFLQSQMKEDFKEKVRACSWITQDQLKQLWVEAGADPEFDLVNMNVSAQFKEKNFHLHRDCGAKIYALIQDSNSGLKLQNDISFAADSLFCEWAYVVDFDKNTFEIYKGFNQEKLAENERFAFLNDIAVGEDKSYRSEPYYPVKLAKSYSLNELPTQEQFLQDFEEKDEEEE